MTVDREDGSIKGIEEDAPRHLRADTREGP
jgi:hypothetical protein